MSGTIRDVGKLIYAVYQAMLVDIDVYGFHFNIFSVFAFVVMVGIVGWIIGEIMNF